MNFVAIVSKLLAFIASNRSPLVFNLNGNQLQISTDWVFNFNIKFLGQLILGINFNTQPSIGYSTARGSHPMDIEWISNGTSNATDALRVPIF